MSSNSGKQQQRRPSCGSEELIENFHGTHTAERERNSCLVIYGGRLVVAAGQRVQQPANSINLIVFIRKAAGRVAESDAVQ